MDPNEITSLASLLRNNGDKVLNSEFKLTLTGPLLRALNDSFTLIADPNETTPGFQVVKPNNAKSDVFRDLQLIYDFVQKTLYLCLAHYKIDDEHFDGPIHIQKFRSLETLEIQKVNIKQISGIQSLRSQLKNIICIRSISNVDDIITHCGSDNCNGFVWSSLKTANFSYNNLKTVQTSLEFAPNLNNLNLSHNQLTSAEAIKWLPNLKILNLSYNRLANIPMFHSDSTRRLQVLNISNNFIEDLCGISRLDALNELDLSENCFLDHSYLLPLSTLRSLRYINLFGNPLFCHPKHREATSYYLNKNVIQNQFILDFEPLSKFEKSRTGRYQSFNTALTSRFTTSRQTSNLSTPTSSNRHSQANTPASSVGSVKSINMGPAQEGTEKSKAKSKKPPKPRTVKIGEKTTPIETKEHLETKKEIQDLREKYGDDWLQSKNVQTVIPSQNSETSRVTSKELIDSILDSMNIQRESQTNVPLPGTSTPVILDDSPSNTVDIKDEDSGILEATTDYESFVSEDAQDESTVYKSANESGPNLDAIYSRKESIQEEVISEPEDNEITYIVTEQNKPDDQLFLTLSENAIKEKDCLTRRTLTKWSLKILQSCDRIKSNTLRINFDTVKKDKQERIYKVEEGLGRELEKYLRDILSKRDLSDMNQIMYKCVACACKFSREKSYSYRAQNLNVVCPECGSKFVAEVTETKPTNDTAKLLNNKSSNKAITKLIAEEKKHTTQQQDNISQDQEQQVQTNTNNSGEKLLNIEQSASQSSIGSAGSLNESSSCSKLSQNSQNSFDSNQSVAGSSTNERDTDFNNTTATTHSNRHFQSRYDGRDSDVEIISNPSESSIEVLDGSSYNQSRKTSEERRISRIPSLETIKDNSINSLVYHLNDGRELDDHKSNTVNAINEFLQEEKGSNTTLTGNSGERKTAFDINKILTESSSSGSATDTYEQASDDSANSKSTISTVLGGLLQSTNILLSRSQKSSDAPSQCDKYKFNYNDFGDIDHRLKFYMYQTKFDSNEHFKFLVKGKIFNDTSQNWIDGIVIMSTSKIYLIHISGPENDDLTKWLKIVHSASVTSIENIQLLPFKVGLSFEIKGYSRFLLILQDILRTDSLLLFFANNPLPIEMNYQVSESLLKRLSLTANNEQIKMFSILNSCEICCDDTVTKKIDITGFFTTDNNLYLSTSNLSWLTEDSSNMLANTDPIDLYLVQMISNLVGVEKLTEDLVELNFLDETESKSELWKCKFETKENADSSLNAISQSWEKLFSVPLINN